MQTGLPRSTLTAKSRSDCLQQRSHTFGQHRRRQLVIQARTQVPQDRTSESSAPQVPSNGVSNGSSVISSNNGVVLDRKGGSLEDRILSGEFSNQGSTKEKVLRPVRQALAKDPLGPGKSLCLYLGFTSLQAA